MTAARILFLMATSWMGGSEMAVVRMLSCFDRHRIEPTVVTLPPAGELNDRVRELGFKAVSLNCRRRSGVPVALWALTKLIGSEGVDGIYAFGIIPGLLAYFCCRVGLVDYVISAQRGDIRERGFHLWLKRLLANSAAKAVYNSRTVCANAVKEFGFELAKAAIIPNGLDFSDPDFRVRTRMSWPDLCDVFGLVDPDGESVRYVVGTVANLRKEKDYRTLLNAARETVLRRSDVRFLSVGDGELRAELEGLVRHLGIQQSFFFLGNQQDALRIIGALDVFVLSSATESLPNAILEAMGLGKPVVATAVGGVPEMVRDGENGCLVPAGDHLALATSILTLLHSRSLRERLGQRGREIATQEFGIERTVRMTEELIVALSAEYAGDVR